MTRLVGRQYPSYNRNPSTRLRNFWTLMSEMLNEPPQLYRCSRGSKLARGDVERNYYLGSEKSNMGSR